MSKYDFVDEFQRIGVNFTHSDVVGKWYFESSKVIGRGEVSSTWRLLGLRTVMCYRLHVLSNYCDLSFGDKGDQVGVVATHSVLNAQMFS